MKKFGLLGEKLSHSYSVLVHNMLADYEYKLYEKKIEEIETFLKNPTLSGMNVTIPYKKTVIPYCTHLSDCAKKIGAVNTLVLKEDGWYGDNTDYFGFTFMLKNAEISPQGKKAVILGSGGSSLTAQCVLEDLGAKEIIVFSRHSETNYNQLDKHLDAEIIVNATPVGMYPHCPESLIELDKFTKCVGVADLIYNPLKTKLLCDAERLGIACTNGLSMLVAQAKKACELFTGKTIPDSEILPIVKQIEKNTKNIVLIGMPGSGKSHIGSMLADLLGRKLVDIDSEIVSRYGNIENIFKTQGEKEFRKIESQIIKEFSKEKGLIISTGGGCVTIPENYIPLCQNSFIIWLKRDISLLPTEGRPLSKSGSLEEMYKIRKPLYESFCDFKVENCGDPSETVNKIKELLV